MFTEDFDQNKNNIGNSDFIYQRLNNMNLKDINHFLDKDKLGDKY